MDEDIVSESPGRSAVLAAQASLFSPGSWKRSARELRGYTHASPARQSSKKHSKQQSDGKRNSKPQEARYLHQLSGAPYFYDYAEEEAQKRATSSQDAQTEQKADKMEVAASANLDDSFSSSLDSLSSIGSAEYSVMLDYLANADSDDEMSKDVTGFLRSIGFKSDGGGMNMQDVEEWGMTEPAKKRASTRSTPKSGGKEVRPKGGWKTKSPKTPDVISTSPHRASRSGTPATPHSRQGSSSSTPISFGKKDKRGRFGARFSPLAIGQLRQRYDLPFVAAVDPISKLVDDDALIVMPHDKAMAQAFAATDHQHIAVEIVVQNVPEFTEQAIAQSSKNQRKSKKSQNSKNAENAENAKKSQILVVSPVPASSTSSPGPVFLSSPASMICDEPIVSVVLVGQDMDVSDMTQVETNLSGEEDSLENEESDEFEESNEADMDDYDDEEGVDEEEDAEMDDGSLNEGSSDLEGSPDLEGLGFSSDDDSDTDFGSGSSFEDSLDDEFLEDAGSETDSDDSGDEEDVISPNTNRDPMMIVPSDRDSLARRGMVTAGGVQLKHDTRRRKRVSAHSRNQPEVGEFASQKKLSKAEKKKQKKKSRDERPLELHELHTWNGLIRDFIQNTPYGTTMPFSPMGRFQRKQLHWLSEFYGLRSQSYGSGTRRMTHVFVTKRTMLPDLNASLVACKAILESRHPFTLSSAEMEVEITEIQKPKPHQSKKRSVTPKSQPKRETPRSARAAKKVSSKHHSPLLKTSRSSSSKEAKKAKKRNQPRRSRMDYDSADEEAASHHGLDASAKRLVGSGAAHIPASNVGHAMLRKLGWSSGGLGKEQQGIAHPIEAVIKAGRGGLGS
jgi:hypothetical protein